MTGCSSCGAVTPRMRTGPFGPQTLCNKCGLRYYRKMRKLRKQTELQLPPKPTVQVYYYYIPMYYPVQVAPPPALI